jgi:hypothetical protein
MPDLLGMMLLLTYSGSTQVVPAILGAVVPRIKLHKASVISGLCSGLFIVLLFTFSPIHGPNINEGISGLAVNIVVLTIVETRDPRLSSRALSRRSKRSSESTGPRVDEVVAAALPMTMLIGSAAMPQAKIASPNTRKTMRWATPWTAVTRFPTNAVIETSTMIGEQQQVDR